MRAMTRTEYGGPQVLRLADVSTPAVGDDDVLIGVRASSINPMDWHLLRGEPYLVRLSEGLRHPTSTSVGADVAGTVVALGSSVSDFSVGDEVFGSAKGALAEFALAKARHLVAKPANATFEQASCLPVAGVTAIQALRDGAQVQRGQSVLVNGASGGVGTFAVQLAKHYGATVTGVCSARNAELVSSLGADHVVDYNVEDFTSGTASFDVVIDAVGNRRLSDLRRVVTRNGTVVIVAGAAGKWVRPMALMLKATVTSPFVRQRLHPVMAKITATDLQSLAEMVTTGSIISVVDRTYALSESADALAYLETGRARGKVVITI